MQTDPNRLFKLFKIIFAIAFCAYVLNTAFKLYRGEGIGYNVHGVAVSPMTDLAVIGLILIFTTVYYGIRWFRGRDEWDLLQKYHTNLKKNG